MSAVTNGYIDEEDGAALLAVTTSNYDGAIRDAISSASREIDAWCGRSFYADASATARVFYPDDYLTCVIDDAQTVAGITLVKTDTNADGTFETTWASTDYQCEPLNQRMHGLTGWPVTKLRAVGTNRFPVLSRSAPVQVTALWGWTGIPDPVRKACSVLVSAIIGQDQAPSGMVGESNFGTIRLPNNQLRLVSGKLAPYVRLGGMALGSFA